MGEHHEAAWDAAEAWWEAEVQARMRSIELRAQALGVLMFISDAAEKRAAGLAREEERLARALERARGARSGLDEATNALEAVTRLMGKQWEK